MNKVIVVSVVLAACVVAACGRVEEPEGAASVAAAARKAEPPITVEARGDKPRRVVQVVAPDPIRAELLAKQAAFWPHAAKLRATHTSEDDYQKQKEAALGQQ